MAAPRARSGAVPLVLAVFLTGAGGEHDPPPPPPATPVEPAPPRPGASPASEAESPESPELKRYQDCFQKMIDAGASDNAFMKRCLGLPETIKRNGAAAPLSSDEVEKALKDALPDLKKCYDAALVAWKDLGVKPNGALAFKIAAPKGVVQSVTFDGGLTDLGLIGCFRERLKTLTLRKNESEGAVDVFARFLLRPLAPHVRFDEEALKLAGPAYGIAPEDALSVFRKNAPKVRKCWDQVVKKKKDATGRVAVTLTVSELGRVVGVNYREYQVSDERQAESFKTCVTRELKRWKFPRPRAGEVVPVEYPPFDFRPR